MAFIPISQMIRPLSDFYDPVKAEQVRLTQMKIAAEQQNQAMQQRLSDAYKMSEIPAMSPQVAGLMNMSASAVPLPMPDIAAPIQQGLSTDLQRSAMDRAKQEYMRMGRLDEALAIEEAQAKQQKLARGGDYFAPMTALVDGKPTAVFPRNGRFFVPLPGGGEKEIINPIPVTPGSVAATQGSLRDVQLDFDVREAEEKAAAGERGRLPYKTQEELRSVEREIAKEQRQEGAELRSLDRKMPSQNREILQKERSSFRSEKPVAWYQGAEGAYNQFTSSIESAKEALAQNKPRGPGEIGVVFGLMKMMDPATAVRESEIQMTGAARSMWDKISTYTDRLQQGGTNGFTPAELNEYQVLVDGLFREYAKSYDAEVARYRELNADIATPRQLELSFPPSRFGRIERYSASASPQNIADETLPPDTQLSAEPRMPTNLDEANAIYRGGVEPGLPPEPETMSNATVQQLYPQAASGVLAPGLDANYVMPPDSTNPVTGVDMYGNEVTVKAPRGLRFENEMPASGTVSAPASGTTKIGSNLELLRRIRGGNK